MKLKLKSSKLKNFLSKYFFPFIYFKYKKFYKLISLDMVFMFSILSIFLIMSFFSNSILSKGISIKVFFSALLLLILWTLSMVLVYFIVKYLFYKSIKQEHKFKSIMWKHGLAFILTPLLIFILIYIFNLLINILFIQQKVEGFVKIMVKIFIILGYILFLNFQTFDKGRFFPGYWSGIKSIFSKKSVILIYTDAIVIFLGFGVYYFSHYILRFIFFTLLNNVKLFNMIMPKIFLVIPFILLGLLLTVNKLIVFEMKPKELK